MSTMDFEDAVANAFAKQAPPRQEPPPARPPSPVTQPESRPPESRPPEMRPPEPRPPLEEAPVLKKKRKRRENNPDGDPQPPKKKKESDADVAEKRELFDQLQRYSVAFPSESQPDVNYITPESSIDDMRFALSRIQQRINTQQELQVLQTGLVTGVACLELGSSMIPNNPVKLNGLSTNVQSNIQLFDNCLKQMQCKYGGEIQISVEATMAMLLLRCAVTVHTTNVANEAIEREKDKEGRIEEVEQPNFFVPPPAPTPPPTEEPILNEETVIN